VLIANTTNKTIKLKRGCIVGKVEPVKQVSAINFNNLTTTEERTEVEEEIIVPEEHREEVTQLIRENPDLFASSDLDLSQTDTVKMKVDTGDSAPIKLKPYRTPLNKRKVIDKAIDDMLEAKVIERSQSPWSFPVVVVDKSDGTKRFCVDFRQLNKVTKSMSYPLPLIDDILAQLGEAKYFTCLDLKSGYWQVKMEEKDKEKTAFATPHRGLFQFLVMPFGLANAPSVFMMLMNVVLQGLEGFACAYLDDVIIFSKTAEEHARHIQQVFERLRMHNLKLKLKKCKFFQEETEYLGFVISKDGVKPNPNKVEAIRRMAAPSNVREVRSFVGMCSYYRRFIPNFSEIAEPIVALTRKYARFVWTETCQKAFDFIKKSLSVVPLLAFPDPNQPYILYTDASDSCIGACLAQEVPCTNGNKEEKPIYFLSHKLSDTQCRWSTIEKEAFAIHYALQKLDFYLHNAKFTIRTDHRPLRYLLESPMQNRKIQMWALSLSGYDCQIEYIPGPQNVLADLLSRLPSNPELEAEPQEDEDITEVNDNAFEVCVINSNHIEPKSFVRCDPPAPQKETNINIEGFDVKDEQDKDPDIVEIKEKLRQDKADKATQKRHMLIEDVLYFISSPDDNPTPRLYVPSHLREHVLLQYHDGNGHMGMDKTYDTMGQKYFWPQMFREVHKYIQGCITCQTRILKAKKTPLQEMDIPPYPFAKISLDLSGPYPRSLSGNKYILSVVDHYSGWPEAFPIPDKSAENVAHIILDEIIPRFGCPLQVVSDNGTENENRIVRETLKEMNIDHITTSYYHPEANAKVERFHRTLHDILSKKLDHDLTTWDLHLNQTLAAVRFSVSESTGQSPYFLLYNRDAVLPLDNILKPRRKYMGEEAHMIALQQQHLSFTTVHNRLRKSKKRQLKYANRNRQMIELKVGDPVYLKNHKKSSKLDKKWVPFYRITEKLSPVTYKIRDQLNGTETKSHVQHLRLAPVGDWQIPEYPDGRTPRKATQAAPPDSSSNESSSDDEQAHPLHRQIQKARNERSSSSEEDDIPLMELRRRLRTREKRENSNSTSVPETDPAKTDSSEEEEILSESNEEERMEVNEVNLHANKKKEKKRQTVKKLLTTIADLF
jgi:hypothetical protein